MLGRRTEPPPISWLMHLALSRPGLISLAAGFTDDAVYTVTTGETYRGRAEIGAVRRGFPPLARTPCTSRRGGRSRAGCVDGFDHV